MKTLFSFTLLFTILFSISCSNGQNSNQNFNLDTQSFQKALESQYDVNIIDVRTPGEFSQGHIQNALNINWNGNDFESETAKIDKSKPIYVYCLSGGRSAAAASFLRNNGFSEVYELIGGLMSWRKSNLPLTTDNTVKKTYKEITKADFLAFLNDDRYILIDFYAEWCGPCKKMKPFLDEISNEKAANVKIIRIDVDKNPTITKEMNIEGLPTLHLYKNKELKWNKLGFAAKEEILEKLK